VFPCLWADSATPVGLAWRDTNKGVDQKLQKRVLQEGSRVTLSVRVAFCSLLLVWEAS
jgi:hypothetical protein